MSSIIIEKKYVQARIHLSEMLDALFDKTAELELAHMKIAALESEILKLKESKNGEQHSTVEG